MKKLVSFLLAVLFSLNFVLAGVIPKLNIHLSKVEIWAVIVFGIALVLVFIYWILQIINRGF